MVGCPVVIGAPRREDSGPMNDADQPNHGLSGLLPEGPLRRVHDHWSALTDDGGLPGRQHFAPEDFVDILGHLFLIDVLSAEEFRYRLIGTRVADWSGGDATGKRLDDPDCGPNRHAFTSLVRRVVDERAPVATLGQETLFGGSAFRFDRLLLPLAGDGQSIDMVLGVADMKTAARR